MQEKPKNVIVIISDSLRYDTVYRKGVGMPYVQKNAVEFTEARSAGCWTLPATSSLFTGMMPHEHGATSQTRQIHKDIPTLAERMKAAGYNTYQVTANVVTTHIFGLDRGFDEVRRIWKIVPAKFKKIMQMLVVMGKPRLRKKMFSGDFITKKLTEDLEATKTWLQYTFPDIFDQVRQILKDNEERKEGAFIFVNLMETHFPYHTAPTFKYENRGLIGKIKETLWLYHISNNTFMRKGYQNLKPKALDILRGRQHKAWEGVASSIDEFCRELHEDTGNLVVFGSDHGENFGDQGWNYHFSNVTDGGNKVPMFWLGLDDEPRTVDTPVSSRHIHNSLLRAIGETPSGPSLIHEPERSIPVMQSYWYDNKGKTLDKYKFNQFSFLHGGSRFLLRNDKWFQAPFADSYDEPDFQPTPGNANPVEELIKDKEQKTYLKSAINNFENFASTISFEPKKHH
ncbi:MAG: sulfatase-like hydrolase/transferase [Saprospiraceae bacterium]|nr:sulfatase-like hydrolase/transferase [Saprospiraceae bacterium]